MRPIEIDPIDPIARAAALVRAGDTFHGPFVPAMGTHHSDSYDAYGIAPMGTTGRPESAPCVTATDLGDTSTSSLVPIPSHAADKLLADHVRRYGRTQRKRPDETPEEAKVRRVKADQRQARVEIRLRRKLRRMDGGATTYEASIRRLALQGKLGKQEKSCPECNGTGIDPQFLNIANDVPCDACIGTGRRAIISRHKPLVGFLDPYRYAYTLDGTTLDAESDPRTLTMLLQDNLEKRQDRIRARAFKGPVGRRDKGARCARRVHTWNHDATQKWCVKCGKTVKKTVVKLTPA